MGEPCGKLAIYLDKAFCWPLWFIGHEIFTILPMTRSNSQKATRKYSSLLLMHLGRADFAARWTRSDMNIAAILTPARPARFAPDFFGVGRADSVPCRANRSVKSS